MLRSAWRIEAAILRMERENFFFPSIRLAEGVATMAESAGIGMPHLLQRLDWTMAFHLNATR
jgi:hypothetical protein